MSTAFTQALHDWQNFYLLVGTASATLTGLMFVAVSLGTHMVVGREDSVRTFVTPTLVHFIAVILVAAVMMIPTHTVLSLGGALMAIGVVSVAYSLLIIRWVGRGSGQEGFDPAHWLWHGAFPLISYATVLGAAIWLLAGSITGLDAMAVSAILLLVVGVHNTWDLVLWLAKHR